MMGKILNDFTQYYKRRGSHSLTGQGGLREAKALPAEATDAYEIFCSIAEQRESLKTNIAEMQAKLPSLKRDQTAWGIQVHRIAGMQSELGELNKFYQHARELPYAIVFQFVARKLLPKSTLHILQAEAQSLVGSTPAANGDYEVMRRLKEAAKIAP